MGRQQLRVDEDEKTFFVSLLNYQLPETTTTDCDAKEIEFHCPCGECSIETYLQDGCPKSGIPYLGMTTLSEGDKKNLNYILRKDTKKIMESFCNLSDNTCDSLKRQGVLVDNLVRVAITSNPSLHDKLIGSTSVDQVFSHLAPEMSFFNHETLRRIITVLGDKDDKDRLADYSKQFKEFCKRNVFEVEPGPCTCGQRLSQLKGRKLFAVVLPTGEKMLQSLGDAVSIQETLADDLDIPLDTLHLHRIDPGSIILVFSVPDSIAEKIFPLPKEKLTLLRVKGMLLFVPQDLKLESNLEKPRYNKPGLCVIVNNMKFQNARDLPEGKESEKDLAALFTTLKFDVKIHKNLTADEMVQKAKCYALKQHNGAFFLIILSHGKVVDHREAVVGTDCEPVTIHKLQNFFDKTTCPSLRGVPKIFLIDACQDSQQVSTEPIGSAATEFMILHASTQGNQVSTDHNQDATCTLAQAFVEATNKADPSTPFTAVIERVKATVQESNPDKAVKIVDTLSQTCDYFIKRYTCNFCINYNLFFFLFYSSTEELSSKLHTALQQWISIREDTIQQIRNTIANLKFHQRNLILAQIAGCSLSIVGSAISIYGFVMDPSKFSLSLGLTFVGSVLAAAGGGTTAVTSIAGIIIRKSNVKQAQQQLKRDYEQLYIISAQAIAIQRRIDDYHERQQCQGISTTKLLAKLGIALTHGVFQTGNLGIKVTLLFTATFAAMKAGGAVPARAAFWENLGQLGRYLANRSKTDTIKELTNTVENLEEERDVIAKLIQHAQE